MTKQDVRTTLWQSWPAKVTLEVDDFTPVLGIRRDSSGWIVLIPKICISVLSSTPHMKVS